MTADPVRLHGATLGYRRRPVVHDVSLSVRAGEFVGLLGPNGAGKTTLIRSLLGLLPPFAGQVEVFGAPARRGNAAIGYMPQMRAELARVRLTGREFVASAAGGVGWGPPLLSGAARRDVDRALFLVDGTALGRRPLHDLSGGERQRLLLAQALLGRPGLLLLDEPLISLDPRRQAEVVSLVRGIGQELGIAVVFSAHELNPLLPALDRVLYLGGGQAAIGTVDQVVTGPVLSRLYGADIEVVRAGTRIFVLLGGGELPAHECMGCGAGDGSGAETHVHV